MFIQEGYCTYSEMLYLEETKGPEAVALWLKHHFNLIKNKQPIAGPLNINYLNSDTDIYYKYALILHTLRQSLGENEFNNYVKTLYKKGKYRSLSLSDFNSLNKQELSKNYAKFLEWYITKTEYPTIQYKSTDKGIYIRWGNIELSGIPIKIRINKTTQTIYPTSNWKRIAAKPTTLDLQFSVPYLLLKLQEIKQ
jgi:aminopeptidase N